MLYSYRVALTGAHLMQTGELEGDLYKLAPEHGFESVLELVEIKRGGREKEILDPAVDEKHRARWDELDAYMASMLENSSLPAEPTNRDAVDAWIVQRRRRDL